MATADYLQRANRQVNWTTKVLRRNTLTPTGGGSSLTLTPVVPSDLPFEPGGTLIYKGHESDCELGLELTTNANVGKLRIRVNGNLLTLSDEEFTEFAEDYINLEDVDLVRPIRLLIPHLYCTSSSMWEIEFEYEAVAGSSAIDVDVAAYQSPPKLFAEGVSSLSYFAMRVEVGGDDPDVDPPSIAVNLQTKEWLGRPAIYSGKNREIRAENTTGLLKFGQSIDISGIPSVLHTGTIWARKDDVFDADDVLVDFVFTSKQAS